ncbi:MAG: helix-turn-helix transcriptional regulator [Anaerolineaceae bacterium]|nr:helix-turn-helix transcriptional regulator [Anaerolineaceae bacterium]
MSARLPEDYALRVSELLSLLYRHRYKSDGTYYVDRDVSEATGISQSSLSAIRRGSIQNPGIDTIKLLCRFFDVKLAYFEATSENEALEIMAAGRSEESYELKLAMRLNRLSEDARKDLERILSYVMRADRSMHNMPEDEFPS